MDHYHRSWGSCYHHRSVRTGMAHEALRETIPLSVAKSICCVIIPGGISNRRNRAHSLKADEFAGPTRQRGGRSVLPNREREGMGGNIRNEY